MATHKVDIHATSPKMKGTRRANDRDLHSRGVDAEDDRNEQGVAGIEHKVPLSEAVLRQVGLYGGAIAAKAAKGDAGSTKKGQTYPRDMRDQDGSIFFPAPESPKDCSTAADVVAYLSAKYKGYFERTPVTGNEGQPIVTARFTYGEAADIVTGSGKTTKGAVKVMAAKLGETFDCLDDDTEGTSNV